MIIKTRTTRNILLILLAFLGLGAIGGGGTLIVSPTGELIGMPLSMLALSPFRSFLVPGILLFVVLGLIPGGLVVALLKKPESKLAERINFFHDMHWAWTYSVYVAFALIIWIQLEMAFLQHVHWLHTFYMFLALVILFVTMLPKVRSIYKKQATTGGKWIACWHRSSCKVSNMCLARTNSG